MIGIRSIPIGRSIRGRRRSRTAHFRVDRVPAPARLGYTISSKVLPDCQQYGVPETSATSSTVQGGYGCRGFPRSWIAVGRNRLVRTLGHPVRYRDRSTVGQRRGGRFREKVVDHRKWLILDEPLHELPDWGGAITRTPLSAMHGSRLVGIRGDRPAFDSVEIGPVSLMAASIRCQSFDDYPSDRGLRRRNSDVLVWRIVGAVPRSRGGSEPSRINT